ncbi:MAG TPA: hypothetical protein VF071_00420 [Candidatus Limnocylindria bacterium]
MFSRTHFRRLAGTTVSLVLLTGLLTGTAIAKPPAYQPNPDDGMILSGIPDVVTWSGQVRFDVYFTNTSGANLPTVNMRADTADGAALVALLPDDDAGKCTPDAPSLLTCAFGTVNAGTTVKFSVVYRVPSSGSTFSQKFVFTAQGSTDSDSPKKSRGDDMPVIASVELASTTDDSAGSYIYGGVTSVESNPSLNKQRNPQNAKLDFSESGQTNFGATVAEEGPGACPAAAGDTCHGDLIVLEVADGNPVTGGFLVTLGYFQVPGTAQGGVIHVRDDGTVVLIEPFDTSAGFDADPEYLVEVKKTNGNTFYTVFTQVNGKMGGY